MIAVSPATKKIGIVVVDDHPLLRSGIVELINAEKDLAVVGETATAREAPDLAKRCRPALLIIDVSLDGDSGLELMKQMTYRDPSARMLAYSMHDEQIYAERALRAGAKGYVMKQEAPEVLLQAIRMILGGKIYLSPAMSARLLHKLVGAGPKEKVGRSPIESLSDRELEVLQLMGQGMTTPRIAEKLTLSVKTIETYREHLKLKLNLHSGPELLRYAIEWSLSQT
jgi:DNA-binding NarL/FixJ family response regulator